MVIIDKEVSSTIPKLLHLEWSTVTCTQQCSPQECKWEVSPGPFHYHNIGPLPPHSKKVTPPPNKKFCFRTKHAIHRNTERSKIGMAILTNLQVFAFLLTLSNTQNILRSASMIRPDISVNHSNVKQCLGLRLPNPTSTWVTNQSISIINTITYNGLLCSWWSDQRSKATKSIMKVVAKNQRKAKVGQTYH